MVPDDIPFIDTLTVLQLGDQLQSHAGEVHAGAGGVDRNLPDVPYDWFDLRTKIIVLDEAREAFDHRLATVLDDAGERAITQALASADADTLIPLPRSAR